MLHLNVTRKIINLGPLILLYYLSISEIDTHFENYFDILSSIILIKKCAPTANICWARGADPFVPSLGLSLVSSVRCSSSEGQGQRLQFSWIRGDSSAPDLPGGRAQCPRGSAPQIKGEDADATGRRSSRPSERTVVVAWLLDTVLQAAIRLAIHLQLRPRTQRASAASSK